MSERVTSSSKRERGADAPARPPLVQQASQRRLSDAHEALSGGDIRVESEPGKGSSFHVFLPRLADAGDEEEPHPSTVAADRGTEMLLLVEDEDSIREPAAEILESRGYLVLAAGGRAPGRGASPAPPGPPPPLYT